MLLLQNDVNSARHFKRLANGFCPNASLIENVNYKIQKGELKGKINIERKPTSGTQTLTKRQSSDVFNRSMSGCGHAGPNWVATTVLFDGWIFSGI